MPEPATCQELQLSKTQSLPKRCSDRLTNVENRVEPRLQEFHVEESSNVVSNRQQRSVEDCSAFANRNINEPDKNKCSGDNVDEKNVQNICEPESVVEGPLGPILRTAEGSVPNEYWAPLADLTKSRPAVENLSTNRYSPAELQLHDDRLFEQSRQSVRKELLTSFKAQNCMKRVFAQTDGDQRDNDVKLNARLSFVRRWKVELQREIDELRIEINAIQDEKKRLSRCTHALTLVESINRDVKNVRRLRMETELVRDEVDDQLSNEYDLCADIRNVYIRCTDHIKMQLQELKDAKRRVEMDLTDKNEAWKIDVTCRALNNKSSTLKWQAGSAQIPGDQSTPTSYEDYCKEALAISRKSLERSRMLRKNFHDIYEKSVNDLRTQADLVDMGLTRKIDETVQISRRLENELARCLKAVSDSENLVEATRAGTKRLDGAMKCAQTRLDLRSRRKRVENCRDVPQFGLIDEVKNLSEGVTSMLSQIDNASITIEELTKARQALEKSIVIKRKSLWVDRERAQLIRSFYPTIQTLAGY